MITFDGSPQMIKPLFEQGANAAQGSLPGFPEEGDTERAKRYEHSVAPTVAFESQLMMAAAVAGVFCTLQCA